MDCFTSIFSLQYQCFVKQRGDEKKEQDQPVDATVHHIKYRTKKIMSYRLNNASTLLNERLLARLPHIRSPNVSN